MQYRGFQQISTKQFTNRIDGNPGSPDEVAIVEVSEATGIPVDDLQVVYVEARDDIGVRDMAEVFGAAARIALPEPPVVESPPSLADGLVRAAEKLDAGDAAGAATTLRELAVALKADIAPVELVKE